MKISKILLIFLFVFSTVATAQNLTISSSGETGTSGINWSISSNVLTVTGSATIAASVIESHLVSNSLSIQGNSTSFAVNVSQAITSGASGNGLTIGAASNTGNISLNSAVSLAGSVTIIGGRVSILDSFSLSSSNNLSITSINTVIVGTATIGGIASISASGNFILGTNITAGTGFPLTAAGGFTKTGSGTSYLFSNINTTNTAVTMAGPVVVGNFNTSNAITQINTNGGNISIPGAVSAYSGIGRDYMALVYANLYDATGGAVTGNTTDIYLRFNAGNQFFSSVPGMPATYNLQYLVIAGGGGGGYGQSSVISGGGGGGGGVSNGNYTYNGVPLAISVGQGGIINVSGGDSYLETIKSGGGGGGGNANGSLGLVGRGGTGFTAGGGGGGAGSNVCCGGTIGGTGSQRNGGNGAACCSVVNYGGAGGGAVGSGSGNQGGGAGYSSDITGVAIGYGSGASVFNTPTPKTGAGGGSSAYGSVNGADGAVILRFALPNASVLDVANLSTAFHLNAIAGSVTLGSMVANLSNIEITAGIASSITGPITGTGSLLKTGTGALTLSGDNRYTGGTTVTTGTLVLNDTAPMDGMGVVVGTLNINQNGTVQLTGLTSALGYNANRVTTININGGVLEAVGGVQHIWNLTGGLNFNGGGTVKSNGGTSNAAATSYFEWGVTNITVTNPTTTAEIAGRINLRSDLGGVVFTVADGTAANDLLISAAITESSAPTLTKTGAGKLTFTGANSYSGTTTISAGMLQIGDGGTIGTISAAGVTNNAALIFNRTDAYTISNVISGTGTVTKTGTGTLTLSGANTYTGLSTISQGTLKCGSTTALGTVAGSTTIADGAALDLNGLNYSTAEPLTINGTGVSASGVISNSTTTAATFAGPITLASNATINGKDANLTLSGAINGGFALNVNSINKIYTQSGIVGGTTTPTAYSVTVGSTGSATLSGTTTIAGPVSISGGTLAINANLTATANNVSLSAVTAVTQSAPITANGLDLNGAGTFTLTNITNNIATLSGGSSSSKLGSVNYMDSDGFTIGTVTNTGITASGTITAETQLGNITIAQNITTDNATTSAITINAGKPKSIGDATGGNIIISGLPVITTGTNGITKLFSGREAESTGLTTFVSGATNVRLGVDETTATFAPVLANNNKYALYRYADLILGGITIVSSGGVTVNNGWEFMNNTIQPTSATAISINALVLENYLLTNPLTVKAGSITFSANIANTTANQLTLNSNTFIKNTTATTITTAGGNVLMASNIDDVTDNDIINNGYIQFLSGLTMNTYGGNITLGGGDVLASGYALGNNVSGSYEGLRVDGTLNLNSGGGNIVMRGKSYAVNSTSARWALGFWVLTTGSINSGTGTILLDGFSQSSGSSYSSALFSNGALTITSANTTADAIRILGKATGTSSEAYGIETESPFSVIATGIGGGITISTSQLSTDNYDTAFRGETNILAKSGPIQLLGGQSGGNVNGKWFKTGSLYLGSKASTAVTNSSSNITMQYDNYNFTGYPFIATSGLVTWNSVSPSFGQEVFTSWFNWNQNGQTMSGLTIGKLNNTANITHQTNAITAAGPINFYGGTIAVNENINTSLGNATGDVLLKGTTNISLAASKSIITNSGDVVLWSDSDASSGGSLSLLSAASIQTGGGRIVLAGGADNGSNNGTLNDGIPDGYARGVGVAGIATTGSFNLNSGSGDIVLRGVSNTLNGVLLSATTTGTINSANGKIEVIGTVDSGTVAVGGTSQMGVRTLGGGLITIDAGTGLLSVIGDGPRTGVGFGIADSNNTDAATQTVLKSSNTTANAISIKGTGISHGISFRGASTKVHATAALGGITIDAICPAWSSTIYNPVDILAVSGPINWWNSDSTEGIYTETTAITLGSKTGVTGLISSNSAVNFYIKKLFGTPTFAIGTTGQVKIQGVSGTASFGQAFNSSTFGLNANAQTISGFTFGSTNNTQNLTFGQALTATGTITAYGGTITLDANLTTTNNGDISLYTDNALGGLGVARTINASGSFNYIPRSDFFSVPVTYPITNLTLVSKGLLIGKPTNTANITFANATTVTGPITAYGGTITLNADLTTTNSSNFGTISLYSDNPLGGLTTARTLTAAGALKYIPRTTTFSDHVTYPIANLTATTTGLTIGNATNDKNITLTQDVTGGAGIALYGANVNINANLKTTSGADMYLKGNTTIAAGKYIESNGDFTHDGNMTFKSDALGTAAFGPLGGNFITMSGTSTVERYIPAKRAYRFLSSSVTTSTSIRQNWQENGGTATGLGTHITGVGGAANGFDATATNNASLFTFTSGAWDPVINTTTNTLSAGTAYRLMVRGDRTVSLSTNTPTATATTLRATGALKTGDFTPALNQVTSGYSFIGNPYQAPVDIKAVLENNSSNMNTGVVYYWDPTKNARGTYVTRTLGDINQNTLNSTSNFNQYLQPGQAVFVKKLATGVDATMIINESHKSISNGAAGVFRVATTPNDYGMLRVNLQANVNNQWEVIEGALAIFHPSYSWGVTEEDANKFSNLDEEVSFMQNNTSLAIAMQSNPAIIDELPMKLNNTRYTSYQWQFELTDYNGLTPYLLDTQNNTYTQIDNATTVPFTVNGQENTRFRIVFQNNALGTPTFDNQVVLYPNPASSSTSGFYLQGITTAAVAMHTLLGQKIPVQTSVSGTSLHVTTKQGLSKGVYIVSITQEGITSQVKWIVE